MLLFKIQVDSYFLGANNFIGSLDFFDKVHELIAVHL